MIVFKVLKISELVILCVVGKLLPQPGESIYKLFFMPRGPEMVFLIYDQAILSVHAGNVPESVTVLGRQKRHGRLHARREYLQMGHFVHLFFLLNINF